MLGRRRAYRHEKVQSLEIKRTGTEKTQKTESAGRGSVTTETLHACNTEDPKMTLAVEKTRSTSSNTDDRIRRNDASAEKCRQNR